MCNGNAKIARMPEGRSCDVPLNTAYPLEIALRLACPVNFSQERETVTPLRHAQGERDFIDSRYLNGRHGAAEQARKSLAARTRSWPPLPAGNSTERTALPRFAFLQRGERRRVEFGTVFLFFFKLYDYVVNSVLKRFSNKGGKKARTGIFRFSFI